MRDFDGEKKSPLLCFDDEVDNGLYGFTKSVLATLTYQGSEVTEQTVTAMAIEKIHEFYRKCPLEANHKLDAIVHRVTDRYSSDRGKARSLFDWIIENVNYGATKRGAVGYRTSLETLMTREGVCGEMAILYISMASLAKIPSAYVPVERDLTGEKVSHACVAIFDKKLQQPFLIDLSYQRFGVRHLEYSFLDHQQLTRKFIRFRRIGLTPELNSDAARKDGFREFPPRAHKASRATSQDRIRLRQIFPD